MQPTVAILSFPGNNCETESIRAVKRAGMQPLFFRWNDDTAKLKTADAYFIPGGFSYEDRGRSGMVAARDPVLNVIREEAMAGKPVIGICNGAQVLVESGLIPLNSELRMSLARNVVQGVAPGFLNEWVWIKRTCAADRCATSNWDEVMHLPMAHGEGRFVTEDKDVIKELKKNDQIAFSYCDVDGNVSEDPIVTPNGSMYAIAGICNPQGNIVALMPHPERSPEGGRYFTSLKAWIESGRKHPFTAAPESDAAVEVPAHETRNPLEIFIDTKIVNNEERTVEQAAKRLVQSLTLKQMRYMSVPAAEPGKILSHIALFNSNKEIAYLRRNGKFSQWNAGEKREEPVEPLFTDAVALLRRDVPDTGAAGLGKGSESGICYVCRNVEKEALLKRSVLEIFANPHASRLTMLP
ncbi:MAG: phosphoribosylformylglycinamidine synthase I [Candidatus Peribacteraceae bacterium]|nr:phosphoribosylformylglycinamidine synthase I [Candidatus Peribacteraceae bacterium]